jgi:hypothetical protein
VWIVSTTSHAFFSLDAGGTWGQQLAVAHAADSISALRAMHCNQWCTVLVHSMHCSFPAFMLCPTPGWLDLATLERSMGSCAQHLACTVYKQG